MPPLETLDRRQKAVLWAYSGVDAYGQATVSPPVEVLVRWTYTRREVQDPQKGTITVDAKAVADRQLTPGSVMWLGPLSEILLQGNVPTPPRDVMVVVSQAVTPDVKNRNTRYTAELSRSKDTLPAVVYPNP